MRNRCWKAEWTLALRRLPYRPLLLLLVIFGLVMLPGLFVGDGWVIPAATAVYVVITGWLAIEAHNQRRITARPMVDAFVETEADSKRHRRNLWVVVANHGARPATDIQFHWDETMTVVFSDGNNYSLQETLPMLRNIAFMPPNHSIRSGMTFGAELDGVSPKVIKGTVIYADAETGEPYSTRVALDVDHLKGVTWFSSSVEQESSRMLRDIRNELRGIRQRMPDPPDRDPGPEQGGEVDIRSLLE